MQIWRLCTIADLTTPEIVHAAIAELGLAAVRNAGLSHISRDLRLLLIWLPAVGSASRSTESFSVGQTARECGAVVVLVAS